MKIFCPESSWPASVRTSCQRGKPDTKPAWLPREDVERRGGGQDFPPQMVFKGRKNGKGSNMAERQGSGRNAWTKRKKQRTDTAAAAGPAESPDAVRPDAVSPDAVGPAASPAVSPTASRELDKCSRILPHPGQMQYNFGFLVLHFGDPDGMFLSP